LLQNRKCFFIKLQSLIISLQKLEFDSHVVVGSGQKIDCL
jgi:hypothetical protein